MARNIYAIVDTLANDIVGPVWTMRTDVEAIRQFGAIAKSPGNQVSQHLHDHELVRLGFLDDEELTLGIQPSYYVLMSGTQWAATQARQESGPQLSLGE